MGQGVNHFSRGVAVVQWPCKEQSVRKVYYVQNNLDFSSRKAAVGQKRVDVGKITKKRGRNRQWQLHQDFLRQEWNWNSPKTILHQ